MTHENETLRWPTHLDRAGIDKRLVQVREAAQKSNLSNLVELFEGVEVMPAARLAVNVIAALTWLEGKPEHRHMTTQLEMVAMNLKNLR